jgi:hypothetical protein
MNAPGLQGFYIPRENCSSFFDSAPALLPSAVGSFRLSPFRGSDRRHSDLVKVIERQ